MNRPSTYPKSKAQLKAEADQLILDALLSKGQPITVCKPSRRIG